MLFSYNIPLLSSIFRFGKGQMTTRLFWFISFSSSVAILIFDQLKLPVSDPGGGSGCLDLPFLAIFFLFCYHLFENHVHSKGAKKTGVKLIIMCNSGKGEGGLLGRVTELRGELIRCKKFL